MNTSSAVATMPSGDTAPAPLATLGVVTCVHPIGGADNIEIVHIGLSCEIGAQTVTRKGEFKEGDYGVYIRSGAVVPQTNPFEFIWGAYLHDGGEITPDRRRRIGEREFLGQVSEGLIMPTTDFPTFHDYHSGHGDWASLMGTDISSQVGVKKFVPPPIMPKAPKAPKVKRPRRTYPLAATPPFLNPDLQSQGGIDRFNTAAGRIPVLRAKGPGDNLSKGDLEAFLTGVTGQPFVKDPARNEYTPLELGLAKILLIRLLLGN